MGMQPDTRELRVENKGTDESLGCFERFWRIELMRLISRQTVEMRFPRVMLSEIMKPSRGQRS